LFMSVICQLYKYFIFIFKQKNKGDILYRMGILIKQKSVNAFG